MLPGTEELPLPARVCCPPFPRCHGRGQGTPAQPGEEPPARGSTRPGTGWGNRRKASAFLPACRVGPRARAKNSKATHGCDRSLCPGWWRWRGKRWVNCTARKEDEDDEGRRAGHRHCFPCRGGFLQQGHPEHTKPGWPGSHPHWTLPGSQRGASPTPRTSSESQPGARGGIYPAVPPGRGAHACCSNWARFRTEIIF